MARRPAAKIEPRNSLPPKPRRSFTKLFTVANSVAAWLLVVGVLALVAYGKLPNELAESIVGSALLMIAGLAGVYNAAGASDLWALRKRPPADDQNLGKGDGE